METIELLLMVTVAVLLAGLCLLLDRIQQQTAQSLGEIKALANQIAEEAMGRQYVALTQIQGQLNELRTAVHARSSAEAYGHNS